MEISAEVLGDSVDLIGKVQLRLINGVIAHHRSELAAVCGDWCAWMMYPPTPDDDPKEYAPYWARLTDVVEDEEEREAIVASWWSTMLD